jgi:hypothetical protein
VLYTVQKWPNCKETWAFIRWPPKNYWSKIDGVYKDSFIRFCTLMSGSIYCGPKNFNIPPPPAKIVSPILHPYTKIIPSYSIYFLFFLQMPTSFTFHFVFQFLSSYFVFHISPFFFFPCLIYSLGSTPQFSCRILRTLRGSSHYTGTIGIYVYSPYSARN